MIEEEQKRDITLKIISVIIFVDCKYEFKSSSCL